MSPEAADLLSKKSLVYSNSIIVLIMKDVSQENKKQDKIKILGLIMSICFVYTVI